MKASVLSTRKLTRSQRELLLNAGLGLVEQDFIAIVPLEFSQEELPENIIFTSKNSVRIVVEKLGVNSFRHRKIFCVGNKTAALLKDLGLRAHEVCDYGKDLAHVIAAKYQEQKFHFFSGELRRPDIPQTLKAHGISLKETRVYRTQLLPKKLERTFEGVLFFSPSAVDSYSRYNSLEQSIAFCIGRTTAETAAKYGSQVKIANTPSVESVIAKAARHFRGQDFI